MVDINYAERVYRQFCVIKGYIRMKVEEGTDSPELFDLERKIHLIYQSEQKDEDKFTQISSAWWAYRKHE